MILKPSQKIFRIPVRIYDPRITGGGGNDEVDYMKGYIGVKLKEIYSWEEYLSDDIPFSEAKKPDMVKIVLYNMDEHLIDMNLKSFLDEYDSHKAKLQAHKKAKEVEKELLKQNKNK